MKTQPRSVSFPGESIFMGKESFLYPRLGLPWPVTARNWTPRGDLEFPKVLHSIHPELYEVLQPFAWTVANGSQHKSGSATLYVRIRKDDKGQFRIIHLEQRRAEDQPENAPE